MDSWRGVGVGGWMREEREEGRGISCDGERIELRECGRGMDDGGMDATSAIVFLVG